MDLAQKSLSVDFHQDKLTLVEYNGQPYVAVNHPALKGGAWSRKTTS